MRMPRHLKRWVEVARILVVAFGLRNSNTRLQPWRYLVELGGGLVEGGHEVLFLGEESFHMPSTVRPSGIEVRNRRVRGRFLWTRRGLTARIKGENPDLVIFPISRSTVFYRFALKEIGAPIVGVVTASPPTLSDVLRTRGSWIGRDLLELAAILLDATIPEQLIGSLLRHKAFRHFVTLSIRSQEWLIALGVPSTKVSVIVPGSDSREFPDGPHGQAREPYGVADGDFLFCYLGSPAFYRGSDLLIRGFQRAFKHTNSIKLLYLLRTQENPEHLDLYADLLQRMAHKSGLQGRVLFVRDRLSHEELRVAVAAADAVVLPFKLLQAECPLSVIEVVESGVPLITVPLDGIPDLVRGTQTVLVPSRDRELAQAMTNIVNEWRGHLQDSRAIVHAPAFAPWSTVRERLASVATAALNGGSR